MLLMKFANAVVDLPETDSVGIPHRTAATGREAVAVYINDVDVDRAQRNAFLEDTRSFIHESIDAALEDLLRRNIPLRNASLGRELVNQAVYLRIGSRATILIVLVPTSAGLLSIASHLAQTIFRERLTDALRLQVTVLFANAPADLE